jgi:hypothetical protein
MARRRYSVYVSPEGENDWHYTGSSFKRKKHADTYAGIESIAGMGEHYTVRRSKGKGYHKHRREHSRNARKGRRPEASYAKEERAYKRKHGRSPTSQQLERELFSG